MVCSTPLIKIEAQKIEKILPEKKLDLKEDKKMEGELPEEKTEVKKLPREKQKKQTIKTKPTVGAITKQISSLMINKPPIYPMLARIKGWEGEILLIVSINKDGSVTNVSVLSGSGFYTLDSAAIKAIAQWRFRNIDKAMEVKIPVKFTLTKK
ncbi:energy transducer TonB [candidate division WOR-3 bacterium]|nr:energy transducer TonB [candidate division WOR-3 bacterium]